VLIDKQVREKTMRIMSAIAAAGFLAVLAGSEAQAARWCSYEGGAVLRCGFHTQQQCRRSGRHVACHPEVAAVPAPGMLPGQIYPSRPYWSSPYECYIDDGGGRFRPCNAGDAGGGGLN
jgi:hypothetical protein